MTRPPTPAHPSVTPPSRNLPLHFVHGHLTGTVHLGDALQVLRQMPSKSVHSIVTDPPYAIDATSGAMLGQISPGYHRSETHSRGYAANDPTHYYNWCLAWAQECARILRPGGHLIAHGGTRTVHRLAAAIEDGGLEIRDQLIWLYGTGVPKGLNLTDPNGARTGWGTTLKPGHEPAVLARRPLEGTVDATHRAHGTGALNVRGCQVSSPIDDQSRWPSNVAISDEVATELEGGAKYFFVAKPNRQERPVAAGVRHPTVKPLSLMRELVRLATPLGGTVLDPFAGSGTTIEAALLEGMSVIGIEHEPSYLPLIEARLVRTAAAAAA